MPAHRTYLNAELSEGATLSIEGDEWHHLTHVMRSKVGAHFEVVNGQGALAQATLVKVGKKGGEIVLEKVEEKPQPSRELILAQAMPLSHHLDWIVEKGTELGASGFWLFPGDKSEKKTLTENQRRRLQQLIISALKQCGRLYLPSILEMPPLSKWTNVPGGELFFGDLDSNTPLARPKDSSVIFIGPESGFSDSEIDILKNKFHAKGVKLHPNTLRAETAAICALCLLS